MNTHRQQLEEIATDLLHASGEKPNYSNRDFMNCILIFQTALMDKLFDNQEYDNMNIDDRLKMANECGLNLRKLVHIFTGLDTHNFEDFL